MNSKKGHKEPEEERKKNRSAEIKVGTGIALGNFWGVQRSPAMTGLRKLIVSL